jgi:LCP family protein required for cell wall assembly
MQLNSKIHTFSSAGITGSGQHKSVAGSENILLIGSDTRSGDNSKLGGAGDSVGRSDTTLVVHLYPGHQRAVAVSIPRDSLVDVPKCRLPDGSWTAPQHNVMFNSAFSVGQSAQGNPACTLNTVQKLTGLSIDHTVVANFAGFAALSKAVGGVPVCLPSNVYQGDLDPNRSDRGALLFHRGKQLVSGAKALQYVRIRHGIGDGSDIGRIERQQAFLGSLIMTIRHNGLTASHLLPLVNAATDNMTFDPSLSTPAKLLSFAMSMRDFNPHHVDFLTVPWAYAGARVKIVQPAADHLFQALRTNQPLNGAGKKSKAKAKTQTASQKSQPVDDKSAPVAVDNGTTKTGFAGRTGAKLKKLGFTVGAIGNADKSNYTESVIEYGPGNEAEAKTLARDLNAKLQPSKTPGVKLTLGSQLQWKAAANAPLPSSVTKDIRTAKTNPCNKVSYG